MRCGFGRASGNGLPPRTAATAPAGTATSQPHTGKTAGLTFSIFWSGAERTAMGVGAPSNSTDGQVSSVIARTLEAPSGPSSTHCDSTRACTFPIVSKPKTATANATMTAAQSRWRHSIFMAEPFRLDFMRNECPLRRMMETLCIRRP
jgi:hypothetical protein